MRLPPAAPGPVADVALGLLMEPAELPSQHVAEALDGVLFRAESGLVKSGLSCLEKTIRGRPELVYDCAAALAQAFAHESYTVQERAVRIALKLPESADTTVLVDAVPLLAPDLSAKAAARFGGDVAEPDDDLPPALAVAPRTRFRRYRRRSPGRWNWPRRSPPTTWTGRCSNGSLTRSSGSPAGTQTTCAPLSGPTMRWTSTTRGWPRRLASPREWLQVAVRLLTGSAPVPPTGATGCRRSTAWPTRMRSNCTGARRSPSPSPMGRCRRCCSPPHRADRPYRPGHVRGPAGDTAGHGIAPGSADLQQALLRLPREIDADAVRRASELTSPAGRVAARWLAEGGLPVPEVSMRPLADGLPEPVIAAPRTGLPLVDAVFEGPPKYADWRHEAGRNSWPLQLPSHPEVVAAHFLPHLRPKNRYFGLGAPVGELIRLTPGTGFVRRGRRALPGSSARRSARGRRRRDAAHHGRPG